MSTTKTTFLQPARWNRLVDDSIPLTWDRRWHMLRFLLPVLAVSALLLAETMLLQAWLDDRLDGRSWPEILLSLVPPVALVLGAIALLLEGAVQLHHRTKRRLTLGRRLIHFSHSKHPIAWRQVIECSFRPVETGPGLTCFSLSFAADRRSPLRRSWSLILASSDDVARMRSELGHRQAQGESFRIVEASNGQPPEAAASPRIPGGLWRMSLALLLLVHGLPLLMVAVIPPKPAERSAERQELGESKRRVADFLHRHFRSEAELRRTIGVLGGSLTGAGVLLFTVDFRSVRKRREDRVGTVDDLAKASC